jgi:Uma2 family endonuclease
MATLATHLVTAEEFIGMEFDTDCRFELDNGVVRMMGGGTVRHSQIQTNVLVALSQKLRGSGCVPHGPNMAARNHRLSVRHPDVSVYCGHSSPENDKLVALNDPKLVIEIFSPSTRSRDIESNCPNIAGFGRSRRYFTSTRMTRRPIWNCAMKQANGGWR